MEIDILSLFPHYFQGPFDESILKRAREKELITIRHLDLREFGEGKHRRVDDRPYGGGPGMVLMAPPLHEALSQVVRPHSRLIFLSPQGKTLKAKLCKELSREKHLVLLCGHYEGIDERILHKYPFEEISIGDYVLTNGALASIVLIDAVSRFIPGVLGDEESSFTDSFEGGLLDHPHYTRPEIWEGESVPQILLSGHHEKIDAWRREEAATRTLKKRPDLYNNLDFS